MNIQYYQKQKTRIYTRKKAIASLAATLLISSVFSTNINAAGQEGLAGSYVGIGKEADATYETNQKVVTYESIKLPDDHNKNGGGAGANPLDRNNYEALTVGRDAYASHGYSSAIGNGSYASLSSVAVGGNSVATISSTALGLNAFAQNEGTAIGRNARTSNGVAIGSQAVAGEAYANTASGFLKAISGVTAVGNKSQALGVSATSLGDSAKSGEFGTALGQNSNAGKSGTAVGYNATVTKASGIALGTESLANRGSSLAGYVPNLLMTDTEQPAGKVTTSEANDKLLAQSISQDAVNAVDKYYSYGSIIDEYNAVNEAYEKASAAKAANDEIMRTTKGINDAAYQDAASKKTALDNAAIEKSTALTNWIRSHNDFMNAATEKSNALSTWSATRAAVSVGNNQSKEIQTRQITNVAAGTNDTDAVNVAQLKRVTLQTAADNGTTGAVRLSEQPFTVVGGNTVANDDTTKNITVLAKDNGLEVTLNPNLNLGERGSLVIGDTVINNGNINMNGGKITNITVDPNDNSSVATVGYVDTAVKNSNNALVSRINRLDKEVGKIGAGAAALAGLHPVDFDPDYKFNVAVAGGSYKGEQALALGAFYRPNDNIMLSAGTTLGNNENMYNVGASFKFGTSAKKVKDVDLNALLSRMDDMQRQIDDLKNENKALQLKKDNQ